MKEKKENRILGLFFDTIWNLMVFTLIAVFMLGCYTIINNNTVIFKKNNRIEKPYNYDTIEVEIVKKEIEHQTDLNGDLIATNYLYFYYENKLKRCEVPVEIFDMKHVGDKMRISVDIQYSKSTGYTISETFNYK